MNKKIISFLLGCGFLISFGAIVVAHAQDAMPPSTPTNVSASVNASNQVYITWNGSTDNVAINGYYVYRDGQMVANTPGLLFLTDNAPAGSHTYTVAAYDAAGNVSQQSAPSQVVTVIADTTPPSVPTGLTLVPSSSSIALTWGASTDNVSVIGYYIYRNGQKLILSEQITGTSYTDTGLSSGASYTYQVGAYDAAGNITRSNPVSASTIFDVTPPSPPMNFHVIATSTSEIDLSWNPAMDNVAVVGYEIFRNGSYLATPNGTSTTYADTGLTAGTSYSYTVIAIDEVGNVSMQSVSSAAVTFQPDVRPPSIPTALSYRSPSTSEVDISWVASTDNVGVVGYDVFRDGNQIGTTASTTYADTGLATSTTYLYAIKAYDAAANVSPQQSVAATTLATNPIVPVVVPSSTNSGSQPPTTPPAGNFSSTTTPVTNPPVSTPPTTTSSGGNGYVFTTLLSSGSRGAAVQNLQRMLIAQGDLSANYGTGFFGLLTQKALQKFQCAKAIVCSGSPWTTGWGLVGTRTRRALNAISMQ